MIEADRGMRLHKKETRLIIYGRVQYATIFDEQTVRETEVCYEVIINMDREEPINLRGFGGQTSVT